MILGKIHLAHACDHGLTIIILGRKFYCEYDFVAHTHTTKFPKINMILGKKKKKDILKNTTKYLELK